MFATPPLELTERLHYWLLGEGLNLLKIVVVALILIRVLKWFSKQAPHWARDPNDPQRQQQIHTMAAVFYGVGQVAIVGLAAATALREIGLDVRPTLAGAGIIGLAIGLGAQNLVRDGLNGIFILFDNQYGIGDTIRVSAITGTVEELTLRRTVVRDAAGALHYIANGEIRVVANLSRVWAQATFTIPIAAHESVDRALEVLSATAEELAAMPAFKPDILAAPVILGVERLAGLQSEIMLQVRTRPGHQDEIARAWRKLIKQAFERAGITFQDPNSLPPPPAA